MKICAISDIHGNLVKNIPTCDALIICGDIVPLQIQRDIEKSKEWWLNDFCNWVKDLPCEKVIFTAGNHDHFVEHIFKTNYNSFKESITANTNGKAILLINESYLYKGKKFFGFPWIQPIEFQEGRWAFEASKEMYENIESCDILITHDNPDKNKRLIRVNPELWFYGHWHKADSDLQLKRYNCSILDDNYNLRRSKYVEIEVDTKVYDALEDMQNCIIDFFQEHPEQLSVDSLRGVVKGCKDRVYYDSKRISEDDIPWNTLYEQIMYEENIDDTENAD